MGQWSALRRGLAAGRGLGAWRQPSAAAAVVRRLRPRAWPARRVALGAVAGLLLLSAALLGRTAPLQAQEGEAAAPEATGASGVSIRLDDLVDLLTFSIVHRFEVQVSNLDAAVTYDVMVSSSNAPALGIGGCGQAAQTRTVAGATSQTLAFIVYACGLGAGTVTAEVRRTGASTAEVSVSQGMTAEPIPAWVPADERPVRGGSGAVAQVGTPSFVRNPRFEQIMTTSVVAKWDTPTGNGGADLSGYGLLFWHKDDEHPSYRDDVLVKGLTPREHTYTGLQHDATYKFRIHACNEDDAMVARCGWWTNPPLEVTTKKAPAPHRPHTIKFTNITANSVRVTWSIAANTGGVPLTGIDLKYWPYDAQNPNSETGAKSHPADDGTDTGETLRGLTANTAYELKMRACNGPKESHCSIWSADHRFTTTAGATPTPTPTPTPTATPPPEAPRPQNLNLTPLGDRNARLSWTWPGSTTPNAYRVTSRVFGLAGEPSDSEGWPGISSDHRGGYGADQHRIIRLDGFASTGSLGLAHHQAYELRVEAVFGEPPEESWDSDERTYSPPSEHIIIIDTPITHATAANATKPTQVNVLQTPLHTIVNDTSYEHGDFEFRYRKVGHERLAHTELFWNPTVYTPIDLDSNWELDQVYGVQVVFRPSNTAKPTVYAGRDAYVWPSSQSPGLRERVASYPFGWDAADNRTYTYRICNHTLPQASRMEWHRFIRHALGHWGTVTSGRVQADYETGDCADHTPLINSAVERAMTLIDVRTSGDEVSTEVQQRIRSELNRGITGMFESLAQMGYNYGRVGESSRFPNEVRLTNVDDNESLLGTAAFPQLSRNIGIPGCAFKNPGCAAVSDGHANIFVNHHWFANASLTIPQGFRFDRCLNSSSVPMDGVDVRLYRTLVHEVTHAFGINYPPRFSWEQVTQRMHHPNSELSSVMARGTGLCGPTQLDLLAIHAKYQSQY